MKISEMFGDSFSHKKIVWKKRGDNIERCEVEIAPVFNSNLNTKIEVQDKEQS